jgi:hypothetical protein
MVMMRAPRTLRRNDSDSYFCWRSVSKSISMDVAGIPEVCNEVKGKTP